MYEAKRIMTKDVITVNPETPIYMAMNLLIKHKISGLPVVNRENDLVGIVTEKDVLGILMDEDVKEHQTVSYYMSREVASFAPDASAVELGEFFSNNAIRRVPIVDEGKLVGVVARHDLIRLILEIRGTLDQS